MGSYKNRVIALLTISVSFFKPAFGDQKDLLVNTFGGLNTQDSRAALQPYESPDLLNVNLQVGLKSVFKRDGYGLFQGLPINTSTTAVHGGYHFQQTGGADVQLWGNDTELSGSVNDGTFVKLATGTVSATWQCTDNLGFAYCVDSSLDTPIKTDGTLANTTYQGGIPAGNLITNTPVRLVVGGVSGSPSTINFSQANTFTNFTTGPLSTDPFTEVINAPGSRLTHLAYYFGKVYWWKDQSFGFVDCNDQYNCSITIVSNQIGTLDNSSAFWNGTTFESGPNAFSSGASPYTSVGIIGGVFFRGQDNHIYVYDGYALTRLTRRITPTINQIARRKANSFIQSTQANYNNGSIVPTPNLSTSIQPGVVIVSSFQAVETSSTQWTSGTTNGMTVYPSSIALTLNNLGNITNPDFESSFSANWSASCGTGGCWQQVASGPSYNCGIINAQSGSNMAGPNLSGWSTNGIPLVYLEAIDLNSNLIIGQGVDPLGNICAWAQATLTPPPANVGQRVKFRLHRQDNTVNSYLTTSDSYIWGGPISFYWNSGCAGNGNCTSNVDGVYIDNITLGSSTITSGSFTSQTYDTGFSTAIYTLNNFQWKNNTSTPTFDLQTAPTTSGPWTEIAVTSNTNAGSGGRYVHYTTTVTVGPGDNALTSITQALILARSTGTYYSAVNFAPNLTSWGPLTETDFTPGGSSITYYVRAATNTFSVLSSTPAWTLQVKNSNPSISTATYMQLRSDFYITASTEAPTLGPFVFNWFEGNAADKTYMTYFQDYIWIAVSSGSAASTNNRILRLDLLNNTWLLDDITSNGFLVENNQLYFGDPVQGRVFKFGGVPTDNGSSINSYWQSKDFAGDDPTVQNEFQRADFIFDVTATTVTYTIVLDQNMAQSIVLPLTLAGNGNNTIVKRGFLLSPGKIGTFYNFRVGENSSNPRWRMLFHNMKYTPLYWKPQTS